MEKGLIHIYTGDGKGKTTAALGLCLRAVGRGKKVLWTSFLKNYDSGEFLQPAFFEVERGLPVEKFWFSMDEAERAAVRNEHDDRLEALMNRCKDEGTDLLVLDEAIGAVSTGALSEELLIDLLTARPLGLEVVLTGRGASNVLVALADYTTEMTMIKHPYEKGVPARQGIEF